MEQRRKVSPWRQSESVESWRKKGGGPWALVTPEEEEVLGSSLALAAWVVVVVKRPRMERRVGRDVILIVLLLFDRNGD